MMFSEKFTDLQEEMIALPGGEIQLRDDRTKESWTVAIKPFLIGKFPVTQELYSRLTHHNPSTFIGSSKPVETVSWEEAAAFCNLLSLHAGFSPFYLKNGSTNKLTYDPLADGFRLPTEAEWQYACQAGEQGPVYGNIDDIAQYRSNSGGETANVGSKLPNRWGLYDMLGNVWEWCNDLYDTEVYGDYRIFRGGGWNDEARGCLATNRRRSHPTFKIDDLGFRLARTIL